MSAVTQDIKNAQKNCNCNFKIQDGKLVCSFNVSDYSNQKTPYYNVEKVFDNWQDFIDYSMEMFKEAINEEV